MAGAGKVGAAIAIFVKTKSKRLRNIIKGALPVGFLGIGEPLLYGVTLPLGRPFITACLGAAVGGAFQAVMKTAALRSEEHTSELQSRGHLVCRLLLEKKKYESNTMV